MMKNIYRIYNEKRYFKNRILEKKKKENEKG